MKLLIIEDEKEMGYTLKSGLKKEYVIDLAFSAEEGKYQLDVNDYDLIIIDYSLPDTNGIELMKTIRTAGNDTPILFLTGKSDIEKKLMAFDNGADDYITKPFNFEEVKARIRALLRRYPQRISSNIVCVQDLTIDLTNKLVHRDKQKINLRRKEFELLEYLVRNSGKILTRSMILDHVWDSSYEAFTNIVDVHINYLRERVDKPFNKKLIKTIHGLGYKLEA